MLLVKSRNFVIATLTCFLFACSGSDEEAVEPVVTEPDIVEPPPENSEPGVAFELLEFLPSGEIIVWISDAPTEEEFEAIELPDNWVKNQPRESDPDSSRFLRSPDATVDGPLDEEEHFGYIWSQNTKILEFNFRVDGQSLLTGNSIGKFHEVTFNADRTLSLLISPDGEQYVRISRDINRENEFPSVPDTWQTGEYLTSEELTFVLPNPTLNIRFDNEDSYQGPISPVPMDDIVDLAFGAFPADSSNEVPIELSTDLCSDPSNMGPIIDALSASFTPPSYGQVSQAQIQKMVEEPTNGPFYMVNLNRFRQQAQYADGRETDLSGREAYSLYAPTEFLQAIGARNVYRGEVSETISGMEGDWEQVVIDEYPCAIAFLAMNVYPEYQNRSIHKNAGLDASIAMVTFLEQTDGDGTPPPPLPNANEDPAFDLVQVLHYFDEAQYPGGSTEPARSGEEAMEFFDELTTPVLLELGGYPKFRLNVDGVFVGDGRQWNNVWINAFPSQTAFEGYNADARVIDANVHRNAAIEEEYGLATQPQMVFNPVPFGKNSRYCEVLLVKQTGMTLEAQVWGTQGLNDCPQEAFDALDLDAIAAENQALSAILNGPRIWLVNIADNSDSSQREINQFGGLLMSKVATVEVAAGAPGGPGLAEAYEENSVIRNTTYTYDVGDTIYELVSPEGARYTMQSFSLMESPDLTLEDLPELGNMLSLPDGWHYEAITLEQELQLVASGIAFVISDELGNAYQRRTP